ncbi:hypothetical protein F9K92_18160 [Stenotrophomonas rhizophila]|uniref:CdiA toxin EC869-like domain-containing protein n=1 Tax=Stenotrophomonas rhizophila TaxID=216778 RepID=A0A7V8CBK7_9GAMM|nr:hypothetical protein [Stenotrophomonas rhizophila]KAB7627713.1 hypothetical protein F9K92_18160 [Stenotrophomonas rhizophila]
MPEEAKLSAKFKTFDFFDDATGLAISAKDLHATKLSRLTNPRQIFTTLRGNIDDAAALLDTGSAMSACSHRR